MIIRVFIKNLYSFYEETEFNMLPGRISRLGHHKYKVNDLELLKIASIYGANGAGKSNLVKAVKLLKEVVTKGLLPYNIDSQKFKLNGKAHDESSSLGIEFFNKEKLYFYRIEFNIGGIVSEELSECDLENKEDVVLFKRLNSDGQNEQINLNMNVGAYAEKEVLEKVIKDSIKSNLSLINLLSRNKNEVFSEIRDVLNFFDNKLIVILPDTKFFGFQFLYERSDNFKTFSNQLISSLNTGIINLKIDKMNLSDYYGKDDEKEINKTIEKVKRSSNKMVSEYINDEIVAFYEESENIIAARLSFEHNDNKNKPIYFNASEESDGTRRLLDYLVLFYDIIIGQKIYFVDEIERSIHPLLTKELVTKFSLDENTKGQLIFTTHESNLLDQDIFRQDEIWFAEKDENGTTDLYPLSDFKEHHTIDIAKGYLNGRYGAIPFLSNLKDLNWDKYVAD